MNAKNRSFFILCIILIQIISYTNSQYEYCHTGELCMQAKCCPIMKGAKVMCCPFDDGICCENEYCCKQGTKCDKNSKHCVVMESPGDNNDRFRPDSPTF